MRPDDERLKLIDKRLLSLEVGMKDLRGELLMVSRDVQNIHMSMASIEGMVQALFRREFGKQPTNQPVGGTPSKVSSADSGTKLGSSPVLSTPDGPYFVEGDRTDKSIKSNKDSMVGSYSFANYVVPPDHTPLRVGSSKMEPSKMQDDNKRLNCGSYNTCELKIRRMGEQCAAIEVSDDTPERILNRKRDLPNKVEKRVRRKLIPNSEGMVGIFSKDEDEVYAMAMSLGATISLSDTIVLVGDCHITHSDILSMRPGCKVLSPVIDCYGALLVANQMSNSGNVTRFYIPSTISARCWKEGMHFDASIVGQPFLLQRIGYNLVECSLIYVPVCDDVHWWLVVLDMSLERVFVIDSLMGSNTLEYPRRSTNEHLLEGLNELFLFVSGKSFIPSLWRITYVMDAPQQENGVDCGVFVLKNMEVWEHQYKCLYLQNDIDNIRKKIVCNLMLSEHNKAG